MKFFNKKRKKICEKRAFSYMCIRKLYCVIRNYFCLFVCFEWKECSGIHSEQLPIKKFSIIGKK